MKVILTVVTVHYKKNNLEKIKGELVDTLFKIALRS